MALEVTMQNFEQEVLEAKETVLVDFWAPWCGPCRMQAPVLEKFAEANPEVKVVKINVDDNQKLAMDFNITSIPSLIVFKNGEAVNCAVGLQSKGALEDLVK
ncbi:MAG: thioredoxin [Phascolarctobacterium sp.]|nr:thioredoxin [Phascolarctobacterium sp.]